MQYSTGRLERELDANGVEFECGSVYDRLCQLTDVRKAKGKRYRLETILWRSCAGVTVRWKLPNGRATIRTSW